MTSSSARRGSTSRQKGSHQIGEPQLTDKRVVVYIRASTEEQQLTLDGQAHEARRWAQANNLEVAHVFTESGVSGSKPFLERKQAKAALQAMHREGIATMVVMTLDRAFRNTADMIATLERLLGDGLSFRMVSPDLDLRGHFGRLMAMFLGAMAEFELACRSERQGRAFDSMRRDRVARSNNPGFGWDLGEEIPGKTTISGKRYRQLIVNPVEQAVLREIYAMYEERHTLQQIADSLNTRGIPTKRAGQTMKRKGRVITISGQWSPPTVKSVIEHAEFADELLPPSGATNP